MSIAGIISLINARNWLIFSLHLSCFSQDAPAWHNKYHGVKRHYNPLYNAKCRWYTLHLTPHKNCVHNIQNLYHLALSARETGHFPYCSSRHEAPCLTEETFSPLKEKCPGNPYHFPRNGSRATEVLSRHQRKAALGP